MSQSPIIHLPGVSEQWGLRPVKSTDFPALEALLTEFAVGTVDGGADDLETGPITFGGTVWLTLAWKTAVNQLEDGGYWVLINRRTGKIYGGVGFVPKPNELIQGFCQLKNLMVHPSLWGQGLAQALLDYCMHRAAQAGYRQIYLESELEKNARFHSDLRFIRLGRAVNVTCLIPTDDARQGC